MTLLPLFFFIFHSSRMRELLPGLKIRHRILESYKTSFDLTRLTVGAQFCQGNIKEVEFPDNQILAFPGKRKEFVFNVSVTRFPSFIRYFHPDLICVLTFVIFLVKHINIFYLFFYLFSFTYFVIFSVFKYIFYVTFTG
jgi:hypothetical protein